MAYIVFLVFFVVFVIPTITCDPQSRHNSDGIDERMQSHQKWKTPCGESENDDLDGDLTLNEFPHLSESALKSAIHVSASIALWQAQQFKEHYVSTPCRNRKCTFPSGTVLFPCVLGLMRPLRTRRNQSLSSSVTSEASENAACILVRRVIQLNNAQLLVSRDKPVLMHWRSWCIKSPAVLQVLIRIKLTVNNNRHVSTSVISSSLGQAWLWRFISAASKNPKSRKFVYLTQRNNIRESRYNLTCSRFLNFVEKKHSNMQTYWIW
jgi:hypothetical protein